MEMMDCVEVTVEKNAYAVQGIHKGMQGWICLEQRVEGYWLVNFPRFGEEEDIAEITVKETDLKRIDVMNVRINEEIAAMFEEPEKQDEDYSAYLI